MTVDPLTLLAELLPGTPGRDGYFPVMALATVDQDGRPDVRNVLLSEMSEGSMSFHTDRRSRKVEQLIRLPSVALLLNLPEQARQIVVRGPVVQQGAPGLLRAFTSRSRYLQLLAWQNTPTTALLDDTRRRQQWAAFASEHPDGTVQPPPDWTGFEVRPSVVSFWFGADDAPSHRCEYTRTTGGWSAADLPG